jgi:signal transduction histidine kinase/ActR/RegA family two-component response regulator
VQRLSFRANLMTIVGSTALAFLVLLVVSAITARRVDQEVTAIEDRYLPRVELQPKLEAQFALLQRSLRDAVIASDPDALEQTREVKNVLLGQLDAARDLVAPSDAAALRVAIEDYYATAYDVSRRMLGGETGEPIVEVMATMQAKQTRAAELLRRTVALDRGELTKTFAEARRAQSEGRQVRLVVTIASLTFVLALSLWLSRAPLRSVAELGAGFKRFGEGNFDQPIRVSGGGEFAVVAEQANRMAASLDRHAHELALQRTILEEKNAELDDARKRLEQKAQELTTVSTYKSQFLANMSHELRTPLNSMLLLSYLLTENAQGNLTPKQVEFAKTIHGAGKDLLALINQVLDLAKVEAGKEELSIVAVALRDLGEYADNIFGPVARHKGLRFAVEIDESLPETIDTDRQRVVQILNNLLTNAIKFTDAGEVTLRIRAPDASSNAQREGALSHDDGVAFLVTDSGVGIAPEHQERVFAPFEQVEAGADRKYGGTGLGLTIARQLAGLLGGELQLHSAAGKGSTFALHLPRAWRGSAAPAEALGAASVARDQGNVAARADAQADAGPAAPDLRLEGRKVLLVDDDMRTVYSLSAALRAKGLEVLVADTGRAALGVLDEHPDVEVVLMDIMLPELDGYETTRQIRLDPRFAKLPIIALTANAMLGDREKCLAAGATDYMAKPIQLGRLLVMLHASLTKRSSTRPPAPRPNPSS